MSQNPFGLSFPHLNFFDAPFLGSGLIVAGNSGGGKTHFCIQAAQKWDGPVVWVSSYQDERYLLISAAAGADKGLGFGGGVLDLSELISPMSLREALDARQWIAAVAGQSTNMERSEAEIKVLRELSSEMRAGCPSTLLVFDMPFFQSETMELISELSKGLRKGGHAMLVTCFQSNEVKPLLGMLPYLDIMRGTGQLLVQGGTGENARRISVRWEEPDLSKEGRILNKTVMEIEREDLEREMGAQSVTRLEKKKI